MKKHRLCFKCFRNHNVIDCDRSGCKKCNKMHNILLHFDSHTLNTSQIDTNSTSERNVIPNQVSLQNSIITKTQYNKTTQVLLGTAVIYVIDKFGKRHFCRVLLDSGSQSNFMTEGMSKILKISRKKVQFPIGGTGNSTMNVRFKSRVEIQSRINNYK